MTNTDLTLHRQRLLALRASFSGNMTQRDGALKDYAKTSSTPTDTAELGSDNADQDITLSLLGSENDALGQIEAAIERIDDGSYGLCETCGVEIPNARLEAIPYTALCVHCARSRK